MTTPRPCDICGEKPALALLDDGRWFCREHAAWPLEPWPDAYATLIFVLDGWGKRGKPNCFVTLRRLDLDGELKQLLAEAEASA